VAIVISRQEISEDQVGSLAVYLLLLTQPRTLTKQSVEQTLADEKYFSLGYIVEL